MRSTRIFFLLVLFGVTAVAGRIGYTQAKSDKPQSPAAALSGQVSSPEEGPMEGVLVTAKREGTTIAVTVVSDDHGRYRFPADRLAPGHYDLAVRAAGYVLHSRDSADVPAQKGALLDVRLRKATDSELARQLTNAEWLENMPGDHEQKSYLRNCVTCHGLSFITQSNHTPDEFVKVQLRMADYVNQSSPEEPQKRLAQRLAVQQDNGEDALTRQKDALEASSKFMSSINLSRGPHYSYALRPFRRPSGRATQVIITEYDLPKGTRQPHDVIVDSDGAVWYNSFGEQLIGKLDPQTGAAVEYPSPVLKPGSPTGSLSLRSDDAGHLWIGMMEQGAAGEFDKKTGKFKTFPLPPEDNKDYTQINQTSPQHSTVGGKVWVQDAGTYSLRRMDLATGKFEVWQPFPQPSPNIYDIIADPQNSAYFTVYGADQIGKIDAHTGKITLWKTPTPNSSPRRGNIGADGLFWFGEYRGNRIGMFDPGTQKISEWTPPTPWALPYDAVEDKDGYAWAGSMLNDRVTRLNPKTGEMVDYLLPRSTNIRRVFVDNSTPRPTFWVGNNHGASVIKLEPLD